MTSSSIYPSWFAGPVQVIFAILITVIAAALGRNAWVYAVLSFTFPVVAPILLMIRYFAKPKEPADWAVDGVQKLWVKRWAKKLDPGDFNQPTDKPQL